MKSLIVQLPEGTYRGLHRVRERVRGDHSIAQIIRVTCLELVKTSDQLERDAKRKYRRAAKAKSLSHEDIMSITFGLSIFDKYDVGTLVQPIIVGPQDLRMSMADGEALDKLGWTVDDATDGWTYRVGG